MTLSRRKKAASALKKIVQAEWPDAAIRRRLQAGLRRVAEQAQRMGLLPEDVLTDNGRDAFTAIVRAIVTTSQRDGSLVINQMLGAEWQTVISLAGPDLFEREALRAS